MMKDVQQTPFPNLVKNFNPVVCLAFQEGLLTKNGLNFYKVVAYNPIFFIVLPTIH